MVHQGPTCHAAIALLLPLTALPLITAQESVYCPITYQECSNGLFNPNLCACECIPPFCPDSNGDCLNPSSYCGGNPWGSCTRGIDCPWWVNPLRAESCVTGPLVPAGIWKIYHTLDHCCSANFLYSSVCREVINAGLAPATNNWDWYQLAPPATNTQLAPVTFVPTSKPTHRPKYRLTPRPTERPTPTPTEEPTESPTEEPTERPTEEPTERPTERPTEKPTERPTEMPTTKAPVVPEYETVPLKFSLMGVPKDIDSIRDFKDAMLEELKVVLAQVTKELDAKITAVTENNIFSLRALQSEAKNFSSKETLTINIYYDAALVKTSLRYAPLIIQAVKAKHGDILGRIQERSNGYYPANFDLCTTSSIGLPESEKDFDLCTHDHQIVEIKFSAENLDDDFDEENFFQGLVHVYYNILSKIEGLGIISIELDRVDRNSDSANVVYFNVDVIKSDGKDWKKIIKAELEKEASKQQLLEGVQGHDSEANASDKSGEDVEVKSDTKFGLPMWAIIAIACVAGTILFCCLIIWCCMCARRRAHKKQVYKLEQWRQGQLELDKRRKIDEWRRHRHRRRNRSRSALRERQERRRSTQNTFPDEEQRPIIVLPPPRYTLPPAQYTLHPPHYAFPPLQQYARPSPHFPALPPPAQYQRPTPYDHNQPRFPALPPPAQYQRPTPQEHYQPHFPALPPQAQYQRPTPQERYQPRLLALPPPAQYQRPRPQDPLPQKKLLELGPVYCDDEEVNRPDPPMVPGPTSMLIDERRPALILTDGSRPTLMVTDGRQSIDNGQSDDSSPDTESDDESLLAIEHPGTDWDDSESEEPLQLEWKDTSGGASRRNSRGSVCSSILGNSRGRGSVCSSILGSSRGASSRNSIRSFWSATNLSASRRNSRV